MARRRGLWALVPLAATASAWFLTAPDPRFAWGYLLGVGLVPLSLTIAGVGTLGTLVPIGVSAVVVVGIALAAYRGSFLPVLKDVRGSEVVVFGLNWQRSLAPVIVVPTREVRLGDGTETLEPVDSLQCWQAFPLCRLPGAPDDMRSRGADIAEGFTYVPKAG